MIENCFRFKGGALAIALMIAFVATHGYFIAQDPDGQSSTVESSQSVGTLVPWGSAEGQERLARAGYTVDFFQLAERFQPQINPLYCEIATTTIILNAFRATRGAVPSQKELEIEKPVVLGGGVIPYLSYSQWTLLNEDTDKVKPKDVIDLRVKTEQRSSGNSIFSPGLTLAELKNIQEMYGLNVVLQYADQNQKFGTEAFREQVKAVLKEREKSIVVKFVGSSVGTATGCHISPVGAYDEASDSVLVLDVVGHKNPWYWVSLSGLYEAMHTKDGDRFRGWLVISA